MIFILTIGFSATKIADIDVCFVRES